MTTVSTYPVPLKIRRGPATRNWQGISYPPETFFLPLDNAKQPDIIKILRGATYDTGFPSYKDVWSKGGHR